jgi:hypothetical protein
LCITVYIANILNRRNIKINIPVIGENIDNDILVILKQPLYYKLMERMAESNIKKITDIFKINNNNQVEIIDIPEFRKKK